MPPLNPVEPLKEGAMPEPTETLKVISPTDPDISRVFTWPQSEKVGAAAGEAAAAMGFKATKPSFMPIGGQPVDPNKTLEAAHLETGAEVELVDVGGGV
jgi:hypothetical protein